MCAYHHIQAESLATHPLDSLLVESSWSPTSSRGVSWHSDLLTAVLPFNLRLSVDAYIGPFFNNRKLWWNFEDEQGKTHTWPAFPFSEVEGTLAYLGSSKGVSPLETLVRTRELQTELEELVAYGETLMDRWLTQCKAHGPAARRSRWVAHRGQKKFAKRCRRLSTWSLP